MRIYKIVFAILCLLVFQIKIPKERKIMSSAGRAFSKLQDMGYGFNEAGQLRKIDPSTNQLGEESYKFEISENHAENQRRYEALGEIITEHVYELLELMGMHKIMLSSREDSEYQSFIFASKKDFYQSPKLMILIHGSGVVRAGQWSRSLIINDSMETGTMIPYVKKAMKLGYDVLIANTNLNYINNNPIPGSESAINHMTTIFERYFDTPREQKIAISAHSYGGVVVMELHDKFSIIFRDKVFAIGLTDSVHTQQSTNSYIRSISRNWVTSIQPVNKIVSFEYKDVTRYSAGHLRHEMTPASSINAFFKFVQDREKEEN